jgi:hypothetical protein
MHPLSAILALLVATAGCSQPTSVASIPPPPHTIDDEWTTVPTEFVRQCFFVSLRVNGSGPYRFLLDSGAFPTVLDDDVADALSLPAIQPPRDVSPPPNTRLVDAALSGEGLAFNPEAIAVIDFDDWASEAIGLRVQGILGADFFADRVVELNYSMRTVRSRSSAGFAAERGDHAIPLWVSGRAWTLVTMQADGQESFGALMLLDSGHTGSLDCAKSFADRFGLPGNLPTVMTGGRNLTGDHENAACRLRSAAFGDLRVEQPILETTPDEALPPGAASPATVGTGILSKFTVTFDFPRRRMLLRPNATEKDPIDVSSTGLALVARGELFDRFEVVDVSADSPAETAGFKAGDTLASVDGRPTSAFEFQGLREYLQKAIDRPVEIVVVRDNQERTLIMTPTRRLQLRE